MFEAFFEAFRGHSLSDKLWVLALMEQVETFVERGHDRKRAIHLVATQHLFGEALDQFGDAMRLLHENNFTLHPYAISEFNRKLDRAFNFAEKHLGR
jgi:hypothetical protein